ncbi:MAG: 2-amino-4-hydroxy-6-hydroxymethyldihydropteridine diphosphokinase [Polyangiaceae bacterium]|nr:2-amino-4-hydroxy-6-hydroxymethyldihydropteridine diphosphokinase [Polyangiaceae bacterium]
MVNETTPIYIIGLGANLGRKRRTLSLTAQTLLRYHLAEGGELAHFHTSSLYQSAPVGPAQPDFFNAAIAMSWPHEPHTLLDWLQSLEMYHGRIRELRWGPRTLDLDILWSTIGRFASPRLQIPHQHLLERDFALLPWQELLLDLKLFPTGTDEQVAFHHVEADSATKIDGKGWWKALP